MMEGWRKVFLADYYTISSGLSKPASEFGKGYPFVSFKDVFWNYFLPDSLTELVNTNDKERKSCSVKKGDVFLTRTSEKIEELGMSSVAMKDYPKATFNGFTKRLRPKSENEIDPKFIGFYLRSQQFRAEITAYSSLTTRASLNNSIISRLKINLPPLKTQRKIASILSAYDDLIENNLKRIKLLEEQAQLTYEEWFVRFKFPGHETIKFDEETGLPEGWEVNKVGSLLGKIKSTKKIKSSEILETGTIPVVDQSRSFIKGFTNEAEALINIDRPIIVFGDHTRVLKFINFPFARGADGTQVILSKSERMPQHLFYFTLKDVDLSNYHYARHFKFLKDSEVIVPTKNIAENFEEIVKKNYDLILNLKNQNQHLKEARDMLLPRLMSGMIDPSTSSGQVVDKLVVGNPNYEVTK